MEWGFRCSSRYLQTNGLSPDMEGEYQSDNLLDMVEFKHPGWDGKKISAALLVLKFSLSDHNAANRTLGFQGIWCIHTTTGVFIQHQAYKNTKLK